jgi:DNA polymerase I-like protein with 3'-5' exonuclease and polymerase domains
VQLDFRTNEVVWWAISAQCPGLARALNNGKSLREQYRESPTPELKKRADTEGDLHRQTASNMYSIPVHEIAKHHRDAAKSIVFGWMFGRGNKAIAAQIKKSVEDTAILIKMFGDQFPVGRDYLHGLPDVARRQHYVDSLIGRRRHLPGYVLWDDALFQDRRWQDDEDTEESRDKKDLRRFLSELNRQAMNSGIQGIASDAAFIGATIFMDWIEDHGKDEWMIQNVVHDSCVYQVPIPEIEESIRVAEASFTTGVMGFMHEHWGVNFLCPIDVEFEVGLDWGHLDKWDGTKPNLDQIIKNLTTPKVDPVKKAV